MIEFIEKWVRVVFKIVTAKHVRRRGGQKVEGRKREQIKVQIETDCRETNVFTLNVEPGIIRPK